MSYFANTADGGKFNRKQRMKQIAVVALMVFGFGAFAFYLIWALELKSWFFIFLGPLYLFLFGYHRAKQWSYYDTAEAPTILKPTMDRIMAEAGYGRYSGQYHDRSEIAAFSRPIVFGNSVRISKFVADNYSAQALRWSVLTELKSRKSATLRTLWPILLLTVIGIGSARGVLHHWFPPSAILVSFAMIIGIGFWIARLELRLQLESDHKITQTDADRDAAKEALGHAYFAQFDRRWYDKCLYSSRALLRRAKALGITLERGFRAGPPMETEVL